MNIVVVTTGLNVGGTETLLLNLVKEWLKKDLKITIFSLSNVCFYKKSSEYISSTFSIEHTATSYLDLYFPDNSNFRIKT